MNSPELYALAMCVAAAVVFTGVGIIDSIRRERSRPSPPPPEPPAMQITFTVDNCCLESLVFAIQSAGYANMIDQNQAMCCHSILRQIVAQVPPETATLITVAAEYAAQRHEDRQQQRLYQAIVVSPARN